MAYQLALHLSANERTLGHAAEMIGVYISDQTSERWMIINGSSMALHVQADASEILLAFTWQCKRADTASK